MRPSWRRALRFALLATLGCTAEFITNASPPIDIRADAVWPDTLLRTDTLTLSVALSVAGTGDTLAGPDVIWTSSDSAVLSLTPIASTQSSGLPSRSRAIAIARAPGRARVSVSGARAGLNTSPFADTIVVRERWISVAAGSSYTCALNVLQHAYCWGAYLWDSSGEETGESPRRVFDGMKISLLAAGASHLCGVRYPAPGRAYCMGLGYYGALGNGVLANEYDPVLLSGGEPYSSISAGYATTCGMARAWTECWGYAATGQLQDRENWISRASNCEITLIAHWSSPGELCASRPVFLATATFATGSSMGWAHSCALNPVPVVEPTRLEPVCWGANNFGQLGISTPVSASLYNCQLRTHPLFSAFPCTDQASPPVLSSSSKYTAIVAAGGHTCVLRDDGVASCWGLNDHGQVGDGTRANRSSPEPVATNQRFVSLVAAGRWINEFISLPRSSHTCALTVAGAAFCWGANEDGQVGDGTFDERLTPVAVSGGHRFLMLSAGDGHTCGVRQLDFAILCWGANRNGQLGQGTSGEQGRSTPIRVMDPPP